MFIPLCMMVLGLSPLVTVKPALTFPDSCQCHEVGPCTDSKPGPGPLNVTADLNCLDFRGEGSEAAIYACIDYFTSIRWYKLVNGTHVPFPSEKEGKIVQCCDRNQTLLFKSVRISDSATYVVVASNGTAEVSGSYTLQVYCVNAAPQLVSEEQPAQHVRLGSRKTLRCTGDFGHCKDKTDGIIRWIWEDISGSQTRIGNGTRSNWDVVCDKHMYDCNLTINSVMDKDFDGKFICKLLTPEIGANENFTVQLLRADIEDDTLPVKIAGGVVGAFICAVIGVLVYRYFGSHIAFWCRQQPQRGEFNHDAVLVHGEEHEQFVKNVLRPQLEERGYDIMEEAARAGRPEILEKAEAILQSYCVILSYSVEELREREADFLTEVAKLNHSHGNVVVIRSQGNDARDDGQAQDRRGGENGALAAEACPFQAGDGARAENVRPRSIWKDEAFRSVKVITWPKSVSNSNNKNSRMGTSIMVDKFWYSLFNHLPQPENFNRSQNHANRASRNSRSSASSQRGLLRNHDRSSLRASDSVSSAQLEPSSVITAVDEVSATCEMGQHSEEIPLRNSGTNVDITCPIDDEVLRKTEASFSDHQYGLVRRKSCDIQKQISSLHSRSESLQDVPPALQHYRSTAPGAQISPVLIRSRLPNPLSIPSIPHLTPIPDPHQNINQWIEPEKESSVTRNHFPASAEEPQPQPSSPEAEGEAVVGQVRQAADLTRPQMMTQESGYYSLSPSRVVGSPMTLPHDFQNSIL